VSVFITDDYIRDLLLKEEGKAGDKAGSTIRGGLFRGFSCCVVYPATVLYDGLMIALRGEYIF
jgi:hypothetical protein